MGGSTVELSAQGCAGNPIVCENQLPGNPASEWDICGAGDSTIQGFATDISVNRGQTVSFKIDTNATNYRLESTGWAITAGWARAWWRPSLRRQHFRRISPTA